MMTENKRRIANQEELIHRLSWNDAFGCHTRAGFEHVIWPEIAAKARWIVYLDIDGMKRLNDELGKPGVNARIKQALGTLRSTDNVFAGQFYSGDEFTIVICESDGDTMGDPQGLIERLASEFQKVGIKATYGFDVVKGTDFLENVQPVADLVDTYKSRRGVGR